VRLETNFIIFIFSSFNLIIIMSSGYNLTITQLSGDGGEPPIVISPMFLLWGFINFNLYRVHFVFIEHVVDFGIYGKRQAVYFESIYFLDSWKFDLGRHSLKLPCCRQLNGCVLKLTRSLLFLFEHYRTHYNISFNRVASLINLIVLNFIN
jgi:hypothetical protein